MNRVKVLLLGMALVLSLTLLPGSSAPAATPVTMNACQWVLTSHTEDATNWGWPDANARYAVGVFPIPPGGFVELKGRFPHSRYLAVGTYFVNMVGIDQVRDFQITPDRGSINPFRPGARRDASNRSYTMRIINGRVPSGTRPTNTLYTEKQDGSLSTKGIQTALVLLRNYLPDAGQDVTGGVGWPKVTTVTATGQRTRLTCPTIMETAHLPKVYTALGNLLPQLPVGYAPPRWFLAQANIVKLLGEGLWSTSTEQVPLKTLIDALPAAMGIGENIDTKYVGSVLSTRHGKVVIFSGKLPIVPPTLAGNRVWQGNVQMRYWSVCSDILQATEVIACRSDEQLPLDANGYYHLVVSQANNRPANAREACGYAWLPMGPASTLMAIRNIYPNPTFAYSNQKIGTSGDVKKALGQYYPVGKYYASKADVQKLGCHRPAKQGVLSAGVS